MIVRNVAIDALRTMRRSDQLDDDARRLAAVDCNLGSRNDQRDDLRELVAQIGQLPERQGMAIVLREFDGRSHEETARLLHTTSPATK